MHWYVTILILLSVTVVPFAVGSYVAKSLRMNDYGWKIGVILCAIAMAVGVILLHTDYQNSWNPKNWNLQIRSGIDLSGGVILIYEVDEEQTRRVEAGVEGQEGGPSAAEPIQIQTLVEALGRRINPGGVKEVEIRPYGDKQVEIIIPKATAAEIRQVKDLITKAGYLKFLILGNRAQHEYIFNLADQPHQARSKVVKDESGRIVGEWVLVAREEEKGPDGEPVYKVQLGPDSKTRELRPGVLEVLMAVDSKLNVEGKHLHSVRAGMDETLTPCINFQMTARGASLFSGLTGSNLPRGGQFSCLGIVMDNAVLSAPRIQSRIADQGRITGRFSQQEVDFLVNVLRAGKLPAVLRPEPISENDISPLLGEDTIRKGKFAIGVSLVAVLVFMLVYYHFAGIAACLALLTNLCLILALMLLIGAAFTLPGLAGLVLTVGMSVDANVLIFERIREEQKKGSALRMAIRNGFARATTTIVDANVTTLITALVLYRIGTDQIRGFAVTLILGILMSMFTAIFCSRVVFEIAERKRWITKLGMLHVLTEPKVNFAGMWKTGLIVSMLLIMLGIGGVVARGRQIFDIDFLGGSLVEPVFVKPIDIEEVRAKTNDLADDVSVIQVNPTGREPGTTYQIVTSDEDVDKLKSSVKDRFRSADGQSLLETHSMSFTTPTAIQEPEAEPPAEEGVEPEAPVTEPPPATPAEPGETQAETTEPEAPELDTAAPESTATEPENDAKGEGPAETDSTSSEKESSAEPETTTEDDSDAEAADKSADDAPPPAQEATPAADSGQPEENAGARSDLPADTLLAFAGADLSLLAQADETRPGESSAAAASDEAAPNDTESGAGTSGEPATQTPAEPTPDPRPQDQPPAGPATPDAPPLLQFQTESQLEFDEPINAETLQFFIEEAANAKEIPLPEVQLSNPKWDGMGSEGYQRWTVKLTANADEAQAILAHMRSDLEGSPVWLASTKVGGKVAGDMQKKAIAALLASLVCIVGYIWIRFQRVVFGFAAVVALVHDVLITLGAIALSLWASQALGFLMIDEFKISLPIVAAFLTIIGYSLNDTIVVFDRIREVRGKSPNLTADMINTSINQTLSRTVLTSTTTLLVVLILYTLGGDGIHGFAFALLVGVMVGTYSSIFVAPPFLLWMSGVGKPQPQSKKAVA